MYTVYMYTHKIYVIYTMHMHVIYTDTLSAHACTYIIYTYANSVEILLSYKTGKTPAFLA